MKIDIDDIKVVMFFIFCVVFFIVFPTLFYLETQNWIIAAIPAILFGAWILGAILQDYFGNTKEKEGESLGEVKKTIEEWEKMARKGCKHMLPPPISIPQFPPQCELTHKACSPFNCPKLEHKEGES